MTFEDALTKLRLRSNVKRAAWSTWLHWPPGSELIYRTWRSGVVTVYQPLLEDVLASDWVNAP